MEMAALISATTGLSFLKAAELVAKSDHIEILMPCPENPPVNSGNPVQDSTDSFAA